MNVSLSEDVFLIIHMKRSKYNYIVPYKPNVFVFFNGISRRFFLVNEVQKNFFKSILANFDESKISSSVLKDLLSNGFIVDDHIDEYVLIHTRYQQSISFPKYDLMIFPTYQCNFDCWYCVQKHTEEHLTKDIIEKIKKHIVRYCVENNIKSLDLSWFGGEPLLHFDYIQEISSFARDFCQERQIKYSSSMTTNGFLITSEMLIEMKRLNFVSFQITIDGDKKLHDQTRNQNGVPSFEKILTNICSILTHLPEAYVTLRFNYTPQSIISSIIVEDVNSVIPFDLRNKINVLPRRVWQIDEKDIDQKEINNIKQSFRNSGYNLLEIDLTNSFKSCYADDIHYNTIFQNGSVDKCGNIDLDNAHGFLDEDGNIQWKNEILSLSRNIFNTPADCKKCKYLPLCMGPCLVKRERQLEKNTTKLSCCIPNKQIYFKQLILDFCEHQIFSVSK